MCIRAKPSVPYPDVHCSLTHRHILGSERACFISGEPEPPRAVMRPRSAQLRGNKFEPCTQKPPQAPPSSQTLKTWCGNPAGSLTRPIQDQLGSLQTLGGCVGHCPHTRSRVQGGLYLTRGGEQTRRRLSKARFSHSVGGSLTLSPRLASNAHDPLASASPSTRIINMSHFVLHVSIFFNYFYYRCIYLFIV